MAKLMGIKPAIPIARAASSNHPLRTLPTRSIDPRRVRNTMVIRAGAGASQNDWMSKSASLGLQEQMDGGVIRSVRVKCPNAADQSFYRCHRLAGGSTRRWHRPGKGASTV
jgi:hypothetical protein